MGPDIRLGEKSPSQIKECIIEALKNSDGLSISNVSRDLKVNYTTASKYLAILKAEKRVTYRKIGIVKLFRAVPDTEHTNNDSSTALAGFSSGIGEKKEEKI